MEIFRNAPLVEMIAELRWQLTPVSALPGGSIDPFHDALKSGIRDGVLHHGFPLVREKVPPEVPREFLGGQATVQFCKGPDTWPLFQLGPGVFTINITEGYQGWDSFRGTVDLGVSQLLAAHPAPKMFKLESIRLMAIDVFSERHGYRSYSDFSRGYLSLTDSLPIGFLQDFASDMGHVDVRSNTSFPLRGLPGSLARIVISDGKHKGADGLILQTSVERGAMAAPQREGIMHWFDAAHGIHHDMFRQLLTPNLRELLQPEVVQ